MIQGLVLVGERLRELRMLMDHFLASNTFPFCKTKGQLYLLLSLYNESSFPFGFGFSL